MSALASDIEAAVIDIVVKQTMLKLVAWAGFFALPVINPVVLFFVNKIVTYLVQETALGLSLLWITLSIQYEVGTVEKATAALKQMLENPKGYTDAQKVLLEKNFDDSAVKLIHLSISGL